MSEQEFVDQINKGRGIIFKVCNTYCNKLDHDDLFQEIVLETWLSITKFKKKCTFNTWLYTIARNVCLMHLRYKKKIPIIVGLQEYETILAEVNNAPELVKQLREAIKYNSVLNNLPIDDRILFELYLEGLSYNEIEQQTGINGNLLRQKIHRIKQRLYLRYGKK